AMLPRVLCLLLANGQTTERAVATVEHLGRTFGTEVSLILGWDHTWLRTGATGSWEPIPATPVGIDMQKVAATMRLVDSVCAGQTSPDSAASALAAIEALSPVGLLRFAIMAACGAMALAVIFGATQLAPILLIGLAALLGGIVRRLLARVTRNLFIQPFAAAAIAGLVGAVSLRGWAGTPTSLVALCPGMVLVPGPHLLNGALDLIRGRLSIGTTRLAYAMLILTIISSGLLLGVTLGAAALPASEPSRTVPLALDVAAAGIAVLAYGTFFSMTWRSLPVSVLTGMAAHAIHWVLLNLAHGTLWLSAFASCLLVGIVMSLYADRVHLPYAGCAFASVVSLIPGSYIFRMADSLVAATSQPLDAAVPLLAAAAQDGTTALATFITMAGGLLLPRLVLRAPSPHET
ncbi:MAG TPA: threonine/serine exporter family protein, partial [Rhodopila sp.]|nr:threonine/serine exporter family protein [Rhodopila sp.]